MVLIFAVFILIVALVMRWQKQALFTLIPMTEKNKKFISQYTSLLIATGIFGIVLGFFANEFLALLYVGIVLVLSGLFTVSFSKKMKQ